jgi:hypothetical protein
MTGLLRATPKGGQPHKARRSKPLDLVQKLTNQAQNRARVRVENALDYLNRFKLLVTKHLTSINFIPSEATRTALCRP